MKHLVLLLLVPACGGDDGPTGAVASVLRHDADSLVLCESGAFSATIAAQVREGEYAGGVDDPEIRAAEGETGNVSFTLTAAAGMFTSPDVGDGWTVATPDEAAHTACVAAEHRAWYGIDGAPIPRRFQRDGGQYSRLFCPDGSAFYVDDDSYGDDHYTLVAGMVIYDGETSGRLLHAGHYGEGEDAYTEEPATAAECK